MRRRSTRRRSRKGGEGFGRMTRGADGKLVPMTSARSEELNAKARAEHKANPPTYDAETTARLAAEPDFDDDEDELDKMPDAPSSSSSIGSFGNRKRGGRKTRKGKRGSRRR